MDSDPLAPSSGTVTTPPPPVAPTAPAVAARDDKWRLPGAIAALGFLSVVPIYAWIAALQSQGDSAAALSMPTMGMTRMAVFWAFPARSGQ